MTDELELLRKYAENASEEAFAEVVSSHIRMVYAAALRHVGNTHEAEEITQAVFIILARKAGQLPPGTILSGWLFQTIRLTACNHVRNEARRRNREREANMQSNLEQGDDIWRRVAPLLDTAIASLGLKDRNAVLLRYVEGREISEVGQKMGTTEPAARQRIHRAVEKLRRFFAKHGVILTGAILAGSIAANAAPAAPAGLTASVAAAGALKGATAGASTIALIEGTLKALAWAKLKLAAGIGAGVALAGGTAIVAITYAAEASHTRNKATNTRPEVPTLSPNSPFVRHLSNPPWIRMMRYVRGYYAYNGQGVVISNGFAYGGTPIWNVATQIVALQPSGMYIASVNPTTGGHSVSGVDDEFYWTGIDLQRSLWVTPVAPEAMYGTPVAQFARPLIETVRHLGLPTLRPGTFAMQDGSNFTAMTTGGDTLEGAILRVSNDRPLALSYRLVSREATITYSYASDMAPLPESFGSSEALHTRRPAQDGAELIFHADRSASTTTNWILSADYGLDESVTNGYSPSRFFKDWDQYTVRTNLMSNGTAYIEGVARPSLSPPAGRSGGRGMVTNQANK